MEGLFPTRKQKQRSPPIVAGKNKAGALQLFGDKCADFRPFKNAIQHAFYSTHLARLSAKRMPGIFPVIYL
ncbi:MAG: hypothetical protein D6730_06685 [Bacteroidetes bacterium]|nr:MAG: hypothetical protein D6730_06685 [Bacteroidota bacterium]